MRKLKRVLDLFSLYFVMIGELNEQLVRVALVLDPYSDK